MNSKSSSIVSTLVPHIGSNDMAFFLQIKSSGIKNAKPFIQLFNGNVFFGKRSQFNELYGRVFKKFGHLFNDIGIKTECFGAAYDALSFYHYENCHPLIQRSSYVKAGDTVLDIGCRLGHLAVKLSPLVGSSGNILCVDATSWARQHIDLVIKYNNLSNVSFFEAAVGSTDGEVRKFYSGSDNETYSSLFAETNDAQGNKCVTKDMNTVCTEVKTVSIDGIVRKFNIKQLGLISLQINGAEVDAIKGSLETLRTLKPVVYATVFQQSDSCSDPKGKFAETMQAVDYILYFEGEEEVVYKPRIHAEGV